ncbi:MAG TPA: WecB/TagA/CpsF family glycosyltransferase [Polyangiaceae bacterium]|nr:WecB/TagA/CpsF family glycosyltransferase [Polyangiaceae bacterium]
MQSTIDQCLAWCAGPPVAHTVITMNAALLCMIRRDDELRAACHGGDLIVADGVPVVWTSRLAGLPLPERVAGVDLTARLLAEGSLRGLSVYFLGARRQVLEELLRICRRDYPGLRVVGWRDGYFGPSEHASIVAEISRLAPHMLFVGMPSPFKETWCERHREALGVPVIAGVGGTFDVLAGYVPRAPRVLQTIGMEWFWRLAMEPRKLWKRYLRTNAEFIGLAAKDVLRLRTGRKTGRG